MARKYTQKGFSKKHKQRFVRWFNDERFILEFEHKNKRDAQEHARKIKARGDLVRIIKTSYGFRVYATSKKTPYRG